MAHALSELPAEESEETSVGEHITNLVLDTWEEVLNDWDAYPIHPAALYVIPRLVVWQFKVVPAWWVPTDAQHAVYPQPSDLVTAGVLEQLWSLCGAPHLWNIAEDEDLCSYQQIKHRQTVAAIVLRVLSITVSDVIADATKEEEDAYSLHRFNALLLYIVMEKATVPGMVHDAAVDCLAQIGVASHQSDLFSFYLDISHVLVDEASRAMQVESLRYSAASVLRGAMDYIATHIQQRGKAAEGTVRGSSWFSGSTQLPPLVRERMNITHVRKMVGDTMSDPSFSDRVTKVAAFVTSVIQAAVTGLQTAHREHHTAGVTAALVLLRDCFDVAMYLNFCTPQAPLDEDQERQTTSANPRVALLQQACVNAIQDTLFLSSVASSPAATTMIRTVIHGLTAFLTSTEAVEWMRKEVDKMQEIVSAARAARKEGKSSSVMPVEDEEEEEEEIPLPLPVGELPWTDDSCIVLPRSHLKTVYRVYLSFSSMLREPLVAHLSSNGKRRPEEKRLMERIPITPAVPTAMEGLLALLQLAEDFLIHRTVQEVVPVVLVWYERAGLPRLPTATEERLKGSVVRFLQALLPMTARYGGTLQSELLQRAAVWVNIQKGTSSAKVEEVQESV
ncbi:hypothetical protein AGDE_10852 [Angomonas deanei]|uniref:Uncharacterized protein n=1 Tax=Angomonas deanei TaxID=59799 RepID=A0A7G2CMN0_9TRYP|nr:hypothetical protein AGDE_10852 [Angomonas deanei]CAD2219522.1 hypothetical protein, conserved [Angomonas deanei]|eukprot:EPY27265.1 hypothetical protein AGDE_10852 [Angomonas deanei]